MTETIDFPRTHSHRTDPETSADAAKSVDGMVRRHMAIIPGLVVVREAEVEPKEIRFIHRA